MTHPALPAADAALAVVLAQSARGPDRDGCFALWLVVRAVLGTAPLGTVSARHAERLRALQARLRSLNPPTPLRRSLATALADLAPSGPLPAVVLQHLVAPAIEALGRPAGEAVAAAARAARAVPSP